MDKGPEFQPGEDPAGLDLVPVHDDDGAHAGYVARCGRVSLYRDKGGRIGNLRRVNGKDRFFPGIPERSAFQRYLRRHPELARAE